MQPAPAATTIVWDVTLCIFSRAEKTRTSFGAHAAADETSDVYSLDDRGRRFFPRPHEAEAPLNVTMQPGDVVRTQRVFEVPEDAWK